MNPTSLMPKSSDTPPRIKLGFTAQDYQRYAFNWGIACVALLVFWVGVAATFGQSVGPLIAIGIFVFFTLATTLIVFAVMRGRINALTEQERQRGYTTRYELSGHGLWYLDSTTGQVISDPQTRASAPPRPKTFLVVISLATVTALVLTVGVRLVVPSLGSLEQGSFRTDGTVLLQGGRGTQSQPLELGQKAVWSNGLEAVAGSPKLTTEETYSPDSKVWSTAITLTNVGKYPIDIDMLKVTGQMDSVAAESFNYPSVALHIKPGQKLVYDYKFESLPGKQATVVVYPGYGYDAWFTGPVNLQKLA